MTNLQDLYDLAIQYHRKGAVIWNSVGLDNPQFVRKAAEVALSEYRKSEKLLAVIGSGVSDEESKSTILGLREFVLGETASIETYLYDEWNDDELKQIISVIEREIGHRQQAIQYLLASGEFDDDYLFKRRIEILFAQGRKTLLSARLAGRMSDIDKAKEFYRFGKEIYQQLLNSFEQYEPELISVKEQAERALANSENKIWNINDRDNEKPEVRWTALTFRFSDTPTGAQYEDLYRRATANYYVAASLEADYAAIEILRGAGRLEEVEKKVEESTRLLYLAMEVFPGNLEFHQDLFNRWRGWGKIFGCPMKETDKYYHFRCPLAIMHHFGAWYVSPTLEYRSLICSVCRKDAVECEHYPGQIVDDQTVQYERSDFIVSSISLVHVPEDPACRIEWVSIPREYFPVDSDGQPRRMRCCFCHPELFERESFPLIPEFPSSLREDLEKRYHQIMSSTRTRSINVEIQTTNTDFSVDDIGEEKT